MRYLFGVYAGYRANLRDSLIFKDFTGNTHKVIEVDMVAVKDFLNSNPRAKDLYSIQDEEVREEIVKSVIHSIFRMERYVSGIEN